ncbi:hypothetical protein LSH36_144g03028 [Paralvinella palmiformis]|uniref:Uncharacterized protein n=1 Tax=Paralvinella palmiformis TaxID=53620 RepID=A0AAD9JWA5_9ANNE|nr:hypothetical protein LSH36_144g03028 [Paralvinella palmiformis]
MREELSNVASVCVTIDLWTSPPNEELFRDNGTLFSGLQACQCDVSA